MTYIETGEDYFRTRLAWRGKSLSLGGFTDFLEEFDTFYIQKNKMHYRRYIAENVRADKMLS